MKKIASLFCLAALTACNITTHNSFGTDTSEDFGSETLRVTEFSQVRIGVPAAVTYTTGNSSVSVTAPDNVMPWIEVTQQGEELSARWKKGAPNFKGNCSITISISSQMLNSVEIGGACSFTAGVIKAEYFSLEVSGASRFESGTITAGRVSAEVSGASRITLAGVSASKCELEVSGASKANLSDINTLVLDVEASGASSAVLAGQCDKATYEASGASSINAKELSAAKSVSKDASGASSIKI